MNDTQSLRIGILELSDPTPESPDSELEYFTATVTANGLQAKKKVYAYMSHGLADLLGRLAADWRGWSGEREWWSDEGNLHLSFSHDGLGHVKVVVELRSDPLCEWIVRVESNAVDAGELDALARKAKRFLRA